jgi:hypothetical protein
MHFNLSNIDLCVIDGSLSINRLHLLNSIASHSLNSVIFNSVKIFSGYPDLAGYESKSNFKYIPVSIKSIAEYSNFIIKDLHHYIDAEYCLIFQHDGFIVNPNVWSQDFLNYDYIGAVFPKANWNTVNRVGNGGFSLRSKRFMKYCSTLNYSSSINEDKFICVDNYQNIVSRNFKFAPPHIAANFSIEEATEYSSNDFLPFGFHGSSRRPHLYARTLKYIQKVLR